MSTIAIYGSRASNGIIITTTKKDIQEKDSSAYTVKGPYKRIEVMNMMSFVQLLLNNIP